ncbi:MAG: lysophospholipid acyltransferase family protein [Planctomycetes bacterium]|nr:lysophospholipid acyltransferase family protein [Planctomycetota bacterium]
MKLRHPWLIRVVGYGSARLLHHWIRTLHFEYRPLGPVSLDPNLTDLPGHYIYVMWHEYLLLPIFCFARPDIYTLISRHADGQLVSEMCGHLRIPVIRGSTNSGKDRGGVSAIRKMLQVGGSFHLAMTPDGPRGPRRRVQLGLPTLAKWTGLSIVPVGFGLQHCWRMNSWDRFALPRPFTRAACVTGLPMAVPGDAGKEQLEEVRWQVEEALGQATEVAEQWAATGVWPVSSSEVTKAEKSLSL